MHSFAALRLCVRLPCISAHSLSGENSVRWRCWAFKMASRAKCRAFGRSKRRYFRRDENLNVQTANNFAGMRKRTSRSPAISQGRPFERPERREFRREALLNVQKATNLAGKPFWTFRRPSVWQGQPLGRSTRQHFGRDDHMNVQNRDRTKFPHHDPPKRTPKEDDEHPRRGFQRRRRITIRIHAAPLDTDHCLLLRVERATRKPGRVHAAFAGARVRERGAASSFAPLASAVSRMGTGEKPAAFSAR